MNCTGCQFSSCSQGCKYANKTMNFIVSTRANGSIKHTQPVIPAVTELQTLRQENERLRTGTNKATASLWSWIYSFKAQRINDIYDDLKNLVAK